NQSPTIWGAHRQEGGNPLAEGGDHLLGGREGDAALAPDGRAGGDPGLVQPAGGVLDEANPPAPLEEAEDRSVVANVGRHAGEGGPRPRVRASRERRPSRPGRGASPTAP